MYGCIYKITNKVNNKAYIGQTTYKNPDRRWACHKTCAKNQTKRTGSYLYNAMRKHKTVNFTFEVLCWVDSRRLLDIAEDKFIEAYNTTDSEHGYNLCMGLGGNKHSEATKKKMSETRRANPDLCRTRTGSKASEETRRKMSEAQKRIGNEPPHTRESALKGVETRRRNGTPGPHKKGVLRYMKNSRPCIVDGFIYPSVNAAAAVLNIKKMTLTSYLKRVRKPKIKCEYLIGDK